MATLLHGLDRAAYRTRFSLNDEVLRAGGAEIAAAKGDLGQLLHAGSSGLSGLTERIAQGRGGGRGLSQEERQEDRPGRGEASAGRDRRTSRREPRRSGPLRPAAAGGRTTPRRGSTRPPATATRRRVCWPCGRPPTGSASWPARSSRPGTGCRPTRMAPTWPRMPSRGSPWPPVGATRPAQAQTRGAAGIEGGRGRAGRPVARSGGLRIGTLLAELEGELFDDGEPLIARATTAEADLPRRRAERDEAAQRLQENAAALDATADPAALVLPKAVLTDLRASATRLADRDPRPGGCGAAA